MKPFLKPLLLLGMLSYLPMLTIMWPLWDDWTLKELTFEQMAGQFKMNGGYYVGIPFIHHFINSLPYGTFFLRIFIIALLTCIPILYFKLFSKLNLPQGVVYLLTLITAYIPLFANAFPQIDLPYLICYVVYLCAVIGLIQYLGDKNAKWSVYALMLPLAFSYVTNSFLFHIIPTTLLILIYHNTQGTKPHAYKIIHVVSVVVLSVIAFFTYKNLFMQTSGSYENYNKITLNGLLIEGPKVTVLTILYIVKGYIDILLPILKNITHLIILGTLSTVLYKLLKRIDLDNLKLTRKYIYGLAGVGVFLFAIGIYPYGVVSKTALSYLDWAQRHLMLVPVGIAFVLVAFILLLPNTNIKIIGLSILLSSFLLIRVYSLVQFYHAARLQQNFIQVYKQLPVSNDESYLFIMDNQPQAHLIWRFYEFGGLLRQHHLKNNKLFLYASGKYISESGELKMEKLEPEFFKEANYGIQEFNLTNYQTKHINLTYQSYLSIPEFFKSLVFHADEYHQVKISIIN